ncbi:MAG: hypothetical protein ACOWWO_04880 [Peptococcaceae bacterium]
MGTVLLLPAQAGYDALFVKLSLSFDTATYMMLTITRNADGVKWIVPITVTNE